MYDPPSYSGCSLQDTLVGRSQMKKQTFNPPGLLKVDRADNNPTT